MLTRGRDALALANQFELALSDGAYLELAQRRRPLLATLDRDLQLAATAVGIALLGGS